FFQAEDGIRDFHVTGVQTCALPIYFQPFFDAWRYSKADGLAMWITFLGVVLIDISTGLIIGIVSTFVLILWRISRPHIAVVGLRSEERRVGGVCLLR